ncbi:MULTISPECIES: PIN/TRAM domain-containing protein [Prochlorococcus]|uniref:Conserved membrane protein, contains PIN domain n=1 Tax=Prochlorococcus marinus (strain SARG / CCMP1375 / SS120) TaxID=167539 RepID=Q7VAS1_PROMA|nr:MULTISPECIES: TRAM domain-containing protein [Prochlorococcus]AAQ00430.1 Conserved membrane protein, contains PIN domain [Prochlorococcus marinus subsp. marinus str. CCMP1375]KGG14312.1 Pili retraction protein pilT [Prochlorococcus marinus str. LG]KGG24567.1 Pili retraction protein pilT [Prochlorococcus marinus str. SS35]KGG33461.1 Pili retraction protein pilT [Prochlorococcus marinus str. SS51]
MVEILVLILFFITGVASGWLGFDAFSPLILKKFSTLSEAKEVSSAASGLLALLIGIIFQQLRKQFTRQNKTTPTDLLVSRAIGLILGLIIANLLLAPILLLPLPKEIFLAKPIAAVFSNVFFGLLGYNLAEIHGRTFLRLLNPNSAEALLVAEGILTPASAKIIDTSVIIDGRIKSLIDFGLIEGKIIVAQPVIEELQKLADSSNNEKRSKGRRGLKILRDLRESFGKRLVINSTKYEGTGVDEKLLKLTQDTDGILITADYNLSQVAQVKELNVLNLSELVIALRPEVQPGERLLLKIVREGKEESQGVGYLDDGTMVVVERAKDLLGQRLHVIVTGAIQTPTGRMVFGKLEKNPPTNKSDKTRASSG